MPQRNSVAMPKEQRHELIKQMWIQGVTDTNRLAELCRVSNRTIQRDKTEVWAREGDNIFHAIFSRWTDLANQIVDEDPVIVFKEFGRVLRSIMTKRTEPKTATYIKRELKADEKEYQEQIDNVLRELIRDELSAKQN